MILAVAVRPGGGSTRFGGRIVLTGGRRINLRNRSAYPIRQAARLVAPFLLDSHKKSREPVSLGRMHAHELDSKMSAFHPTDEGTIHLQRPGVIRHQDR